MAKVQEEIIVIRVSVLTKDHAEPVSHVSDETLMALSQVAEELIGAGAIVEVERAQ